MKEFLKFIKEEPLEAIGSILFLAVLSILFYVCMWIFY